MIIFKQIKDLQKHIQQEKVAGKRIGFFPTMGALHDGHISLLKKAQSESDVSVCSIFVNPTQFNDKNDFDKYPITIENDIYLLETNGCDILFLPDVNEIYPNGQTLTQTYHLGSIEHLLEGAFRPGHFQGVCQVVHRLLEIVQPDQLFMGQKDYQQIMVVQKMVAEKRINVQMVIVPTKRAENGLALSSRNARLTDSDKIQALVLSRTLSYIKDNIAKEDFRILETNAAQQILGNGFSKVDYVSIRNANDLSEVNQYDSSTPLVVLTAAYIDGVRLIDNLLVGF
ncbi:MULTISPECIES: pantoate--beta-alanine ligase [Chitinophagaceae]